MQGRHFVVKAYKPALKRAGIEGVTDITLRHTFASRAVTAGVDIRTVQELMGHSTITMTMRYAHLSPAHLREAVNRASLGSLTVKTSFGTVTKTMTNENQARLDEREEAAEVFEELAEVSGGAGRVRTAASQFCSSPDPSETTDDQGGEDTTPAP